jgi:hypothetical protein
MSRRLPVASSPGPLEDYAVRFDDLFRARAQREGFRRYLEGLLLPAERNKTLTALANTERPGLERLPGEDRHSDPPPLAVSVLRLFILLVGVWELADRRRGGVGPNMRREIYPPGR